VIPKYGTDSFRVGMAAAEVLTSTIRRAIVVDSLPPLCSVKSPPPRRAVVVESSPPRQTPDAPPPCHLPEAPPPPSAASLLDVAAGRRLRRRDCVQEENGGVRGRRCEWGILLGSRAASLSWSDCFLVERGRWEIDVCESFDRNRTPQRGSTA
jgi:hypothetical protein